MFHIDVGWAWRGIVPENELPQWKLARMFSFKARESQGKWNRSRKALISSIFW